MLIGWILGAVWGFCVLTFMSGWIESKLVKSRILWVSVAAVGIPFFWLVVWLITGGPD